MFDFPFALLTGTTHLSESCASFLLSHRLNVKKGNGKSQSTVRLHIPTWPGDSLAADLEQRLSTLRGASPLETACCGQPYCHLCDRCSHSTVAPILEGGFLSDLTMFVLMTVPWPWDSDSSQGSDHGMLWTECLCAPKMHTLKPYPPWWWHLEMEHLGG